MTALVRGKALAKGNTPAKPNNTVVIGGSLLSFVIILIVLGIVSVAVGAVATLINYYVSNMRIEAAGFFGATLGGWLGVLASRMSCDALLKHYSKSAAFFFIIAIAVSGLYIEIFQLPLEWTRLTPVIQLIVISIAGYVYFWKDAPIDF